MFEKNTNQVDRYKLNKSTEMLVKNTRVEEKGVLAGYVTTVTLKHKCPFADQPLTFSNADEMSDFICNIDLTENQLSLPGMEISDGGDKK